MLEVEKSAPADFSPWVGILGVGTVSGKRAARSPTQIQRDRVKIAEMYCRGLYQSQIARNLKLSQQTISRDLKAIRKLWAERAVASFDQHVSNELAKIDNLERKYWEAWNKSLSKKYKEKKSTSVGGKYDIDMNSTEVELERDGNPAFLQGVERCINMRMKLLGLEAPTKTDITTGGEPLQIKFVWDDVGDDNSGHN